MKDLTNGELQKIRDFADKTGQKEQFENVLNTLLRREQINNIGNGGKPSEVLLYPDFAPYSLYWEWVSLESQRLIMNGGLIYHGQHDNGGDGGWSIHT